MKTQPRPHSRPAFTLIELLTVIAIIGILAAILIPVVGRVRKAAYASTTASNLRQLQMANLSYANDNKGFFVANWPEGGAYSNGWWQYQPFLTYLGTQPPASGGNNHGWDFSPKVARCGQPIEPLNTDGKKGDAYGTIAMNESRFSHYTDGTAMPRFNGAYFLTGKIKADKIPVPSRYMIFCDAAGYAVSYDNRLQWVNDDPSNGNLGVAFRNGGDSAKIVMADGHVKSITRADIQTGTADVQAMFYYDGAR